MFAKRIQASPDGLGGCVVISHMVLEHQNHDCVEEIVAQYPERRRLNENEKKIVGSLINYKVEPAILQR